VIRALRSAFNHAGLRRVLVRLRTPLVLIALAAALPFIRSDWLLAGLSISMLGEAIQLWSFASLDKNSDLAIRGPYAIVRNPVYLGRFFVIFGFLMLLADPWALLAFAIVYGFYMDTRVEREEARLRPVFGARYDTYRAQVRRFLPGRPLAGQPVAYWNWSLFEQNHALANLAGTLLVWAMAVAWLYFN
jgi:protein-S-isoprenylcysteine O-methyltransferase Ste14